MTLSPDDAVTAALGVLTAMARMNAEGCTSDSINEAHDLVHTLIDNTDVRGVAWALADICLMATTALGHDPVEFFSDYALRVAQKIADKPDPRSADGTRDHT